MLREIVRGYVNDSYKMGFFAITNACNNRCIFCGIWKDRPKFVKLEDAKAAIDRLHENGFDMLQLTGGEPLLNPNFFDMVKYAKGKGMIVFAPTNGTLINEQIADRLKESKIDQVSISLHHYRPKSFERTSGKKGILGTVVKTIKLLNEKKVPVSVLCTISRENIKDLESIVKFVQKMNVSISFCLPMKATKTSFSLGGDEKTTDISDGELKDALLRIIELKKSGYNVINTMEYLLDTVRYLDGKCRHPCMVGRFVYVDWVLNAYPCMSKGKPVKIWKYDFAKTGLCNECMLQCFREPSVLFSKPLKTAIKETPFILSMGLNRAKTLLR